MADPTTIVPYHDPFDDIASTEHILLFDDDDDPTLCFSESHSFPEPNSCNPSILQSINDGVDDPFVDPFVWNMCNDHTVENSQAGPSVPNGQDGENCNPQGCGFGNPIQLSVWPVSSVPYNCSCCQVLREITHTNGTHMTKLEIHGRLGMICHAILMNRYGADLITRKEEYQMFDFCQESIKSVKQFLVQYCEERKQGGYMLLQDPLLIFYEALCVGMNGDDVLDTDDYLHPSPTQPEDCQMNQPELYTMNQPEAERETMIPNKNSLAAQRERTGKLTLKDFIKYFHLPIDDAAKKMNVCPTVMKKICRKHGLLRWPYRKIKSIERKISKRKESLTATNVEERARAKADMERLQQELANIFAAFGDR